MNHRVVLAWCAAAASALLAAGVITGAANAGEPPHRAAAVPAAPGDSATTTVDTPDGERTLSVSPVSGLPAAGAQLTVSGAGFDPSGDLWVAVCQDDGAAPESMAHCLGGPIPDFNASSSWGVITADGQAPFAGPVAAKWRGNGSFKITLQLLAASGQDADCLGGGCSVYVRSSDDDDRSNDASLPIQFTVPSTGTEPPRTTAVMSTETIGVVETTVGPDALGEASVPAGQEQTVTFSGFAPRENVDVTLFSDPIELPQAKADGNGVVAIVFDVPEDLPVGEHLIQAVGRKSGVTGIAQFTVTEAEATESESSEASTTEETVETSTPATSESVPTSESAPISETVSTSESEVATAPTTTGTTEIAAGPAEDSGSSNRSLWLLIALIAIVIIGGAAGLVVMLRRRRDGDDDLPLVAAQPVPPAPGFGAAQGPMAPGGAAGLGQPGYPGAPAPEVRPSWQAEPSPVTSWQPEAPPTPSATSWEAPWQPGSEPEPTWSPQADPFTGLFGDSGARERPDASTTPPPDDPSARGRHHRED